MRIHSALDAQGATPQVLGHILDGSTLQFIPDESETLHVEWELTRTPATNAEWPTDVIECEIRTVDCDGQVWSATSRVTSELLLRELETANFEGRIHRWDERTQGICSIPKGERVPYLSGIRFFSDDRSYRSFNIGAEVAGVIFKYSELVFDLFMVDSHLFGKTVVACLRQSADFDPTQPLGDARGTHELPSLVFHLLEVLPRLLYSNGVVQNHDGSWHQTTFPQPLVFEKTNETGPPQDTVVVVRGPLPI